MHVEGGMDVIDGPCAWLSDRRKHVLEHRAIRVRDDKIWTE